MKSAIAVIALFGFFSFGRSFDVPEPLFEVFHPKGLRVSVPDSDGIKSVQFLFSVKPENEDAVEMYDDADRSEEGRWIYWNPEAILQKDDEIYYKITVEYDDLYWNKEGEYTVDKVFSLGGGMEEDKGDGRELYGGQESTSLFRHRHRGLITEGKKSSYHSSYSSYQSPDSKPITRSSTSSATGTFLVRPNGEVEASGYKKSESYDSTKREGEQWEMSESEMTTEELEELKRFIGPSFRSFSELTQGQVEEFKRLRGSNFHIPERLMGPVPQSVHPSARSYEESYFSKESSSSVRNQGQTADYVRNPSNYQNYQQRQSALESSSTGRVKPLYQPTIVPVRPASTNRYEEHRYNHQSTSTVAHPVPLSHIADREDDNYQQEIPVALPPTRQPSRSYDFSRGESHRVVSNQASSRTAVSDPSPSYLTEIELERQSAQSASSRRHDSYSDDVQVVEKPKYQAESHYRGSVFRSITASRVSQPEECTTWSETNYDHVTDLKEIQKSISKMGCLASLAENSMKEELKLLKQQNEDLLRRVDSIDREFRRYQTAYEHLFLFLHSNYYNLEKTEDTIESYFCIRTTSPELFSNKSPFSKSVKSTWDITEMVAVLKTTPEGYNVLMYRLSDFEPSKLQFNDALKSFFLFNDIRLSENGLSPGYIVIFDMKGVSLGHLTRINLSSIRKFMNYM